MHFISKHKKFGRVQRPTAMSSAAANVIPSPSSFATILRRSKFATYDPRIGQVYTTRGGHAARGDWGVKRPLANRRRDARITLQSIDTMYQQTEWKNAYNDAVWMKKFSDLGVSPDVDLDSNWYSYAGERTLEWHVDSDYAPRKAGKSKKAPKNSAFDAVESEGRKRTSDYYNFSVIPNTATMNESQFRGYIKHLRSSRQEFQEFLKAEGGQKSSTQHYEFSRLAKTADKRHLQFVSKKVQADANERQTVLRVPHATAGLSYTHAPPMQQYFYKKTLPGRRLQIDTSPRRDRDRSTTIIDVALGGFIGEESLHKKYGSVSVTDFGTVDGEFRTVRESGRGTFRATSSVLLNTPQTVGTKPEPLEMAAFKFGVQTFDDAARSNPHRPGSREYIAHVDVARLPLQISMSKVASQVPSATLRATEQRQREATSKILLNQLQGMIRTNTRRKGVESDPDDSS